ncbi:MAG: hypothetical protein ACKVYV_19180 [Limisphaerales bacterium]
MKTPRSIQAALAAAFSAGLVAQAAPFNLNNGPGDATVSVGVDGFGAFGSDVGPDSANAVYNPVGAVPPGGTSYESGVAIRFGNSGGRRFLTSGDIGGSGGLANPAVAGTPLSGTSAFSFGGLNFALTQSLVPLFDNANTQIGTRLEQVYDISNPGASASSFELIRYLDGDLLFDGSLVDGGGRLFLGPTEVLFEIDSATGAGTATTFVGITAEGGTIPATGRYEIDVFSGLRGRIVAGTALDDLVTGDGGDADQFIDAGGGYDVTLALRNTFNIPVGGTAQYVTATIFGSGAPRVVQPPGVIPEASTVWTMAGLGLLAGGTWLRRRNR